MIAGGAVGPPPPADGLPNDDTLALQARELLGVIASQSRFSGSEREAQAREVCASLLAEQGMAVTEVPFTFSEFPGRYGAPLVAFLWLVTALLTGYIYIRNSAFPPAFAVILPNENSFPGGAPPAIVTLLLGLLISSVAGRWLVRNGTHRFPWMRSKSSNLVATRGQPSVWLIAHLDSKSQTLPMIARIACIVEATVAFALLGLLLVVDLIGFSITIGHDGPPLVAIVAGLAALTTIPVILCLITDKSPGALDNASGVIGVILGCKLLPRTHDLGIILTSAEEFALAGARFHVRSEQSPAVAINCDTIDDDGQFLCMGSTRPVDAAAVSVAQAVVRASVRTGLTVRVRGIIPGILADSMAFADAGWDSVTISRGNIATLARVHTSGDTRQRLKGTGIAHAARLIAATVEELG
jgi:hypothetical protein